MKNYYYDIQAKLIKDWDKHKQFCWGVNDDSFTFTTDGFVAYRIPKRFFMLDTEVLTNKRQPSDLFEKYFKRDADDEPNARVTGTRISGITEVTIIKSVEQEVMVDTKLFKPFASPDFSFRIVSSTQPVQIFLNGYVFAIIMPRRGR